MDWLSDETWFSQGQQGVIVPNLPGFLRLFREIWLMQFRPSATTNLAHFWVSPGCLRRSSPADSDEVLLAYARGGMPSLSRFEKNWPKRIWSESYRSNVVSPTINPNWEWYYWVTTLNGVQHSYARWHVLFVEFFCHHPLYIQHMQDLSHWCWRSPLSKPNSSTIKQPI